MNFGDANWGWLQWFFFAADATVKASVVLTAGLIAAWIWRRAAAASRHAIWTAALGCLALLPALSAVAAAWSFRVPVAGLRTPARGTAVDNSAARGDSAPSPTSTPGGTAGALASAASARETDAPPASARAAVAPAQSNTADAAAVPSDATHDRPSFALDGPLVCEISRVLLPIWLAGMLVFAIRLALGLAALRHLQRSARRVESGPLADLLASLAGRVGVRRPVTLLLGQDGAMPMTWGLWQPVILLPREANGWPLERLRSVLLHELAHIRRYDCLTQLIAYAVRAAYWFHPLAWWAGARLRLEQERACDDAVLRSGVRASVYAEHLLALSTSLPPRLVHSPLALAISGPGRLRRRIVGLLDDTSNRRALQRPWALGVLTAALVLVGVLAPMALRAVQAVPFPGPVMPLQAGDPTDPVVTKLAEAYRTLAKSYVKKIDDKKLVADAVKGMLSSLGDPFADYYDADTLARFKNEFAGKLTGIGVQIKADQGQIKVVTPLENSPAFKAGLRPGDVILAVDGKTTADMTLEDCVKKILGKAGTSVKLTVQQEQAKKEFTITRAQLKVAAVAGFRRDGQGNWDYLLDPAAGVGYLQIQQFNGTVAEEVTSAVKEMDKKGLKGLVLDLRNCPGGLLNQAVAVADLFLSEGTILTIKDHDQKESAFKAKKDDDLGNFPIVVLINQHTASSAEVLAGALQDNKRAVLVGTRTFGKGTVQGIIPLKDGSALRLTTAWFYLPSGRNIQKKPGERRWGVDPDTGFYLPLSNEQAKAQEAKARERLMLGGKTPPAVKLTPESLAKEYADPQLAAALKAMVARLDTGKFAPIAKTQDAVKVQLEQLAELQKQQQATQRQLEQIQQQLLELESILGKEKK